MTNKLIAGSNPAEPLYARRTEPLEDRKEDKEFRIPRSLLGCWLRKPQVGGSSPPVGSIHPVRKRAAPNLYPDVPYSIG